MNDQAARLRELAGRGEGNPLHAPMQSVAITSGKGGVGKSNIALNLGIILSRLGRRTLLLDADLGLADVDVLLGVGPHLTVNEVLFGEKTLAEVMVTGPCGLRVIPGGSGIQELTSLTYYQREQLLAGLRAFEWQTDLLLIDTGAGISRNVLGFLAAADKVLVVITPEPTSLTDGYALIKLLARFRLHSEVLLLVNRANGPGQAQAAYEKMERVAQRFLDVKLSFLGWLPEDAMVGRAVMRQEPVTLAFPNASAVRALEDVARKLTGQEVERARGAGGFVQRLARILR